MLEDYRARHVGATETRPGGNHVDDRGCYITLVVCDPDTEVSHCCYKVHGADLLSNYPPKPSRSKHV